MTTSSPLLEEMRKDTRKGCCIACDLPLKNRKGAKPRTSLCGLRECARLYARIYKSGRRAVDEAAVAK